MSHSNCPVNNDKERCQYENANLGPEWHFLSVDVIFFYNCFDPVSFCPVSFMVSRQFAPENWRPENWLPTIGSWKTDSRKEENWLPENWPPEKLTPRILEWKIDSRKIGSWKIDARKIDSQDFRNLASHFKVFCYWPHWLKGSKILQTCLL